jgi:hypothetical protein
MAESEPTAGMEPEAHPPAELPPDSSDPFDIAAHLGPGPDETIEEKQFRQSDHDKQGGNS